MKNKSNTKPAAKDPWKTAAAISAQLRQLVPGMIMWATVVPPKTDDEGQKNFVIVKLGDTSVTAMLHFNDVGGGSTVARRRRLHEQLIPGAVTVVEIADISRSGLHDKVTVSERKWQNDFINSHLQVGSVTAGTIVDVTKIGFFVRILTGPAAGIEALYHYPMETSDRENFEHMIGHTSTFMVRNFGEDDRGNMRINLTPRPSI